MAIIRDQKSTQAEIEKAADVLHETVQETVGPATAGAQAGLAGAADAVQATADQVTRAFSLGGSGAETFARQSSQGLDAFTQVGTTLAQGVQEISQAWVSVVQEQTQRNLDGLTALAGCRSVQDLVGVQTRLVRESVQGAVESNRRLAELSLKVASDAAQTVTRRVTEAATRAA